MRRYLLLVTFVTLFDRPAYACGCFSPPAVSEGDFAVNQSAEQIIFEVEPGWVTAHVLIRYAGDASQFAWIVPVPEMPELGISPASAFGLLDRATTPNLRVDVEDVCPRSEWACYVEGDANAGCTPGPAAAPSPTPGHFVDDAGLDAAAPVEPPPVEVIAEKTVGDYATVTFRASETSAAVQWLRDNGFVVNASTSIYMEPYVQENMVFLAAKLVPGADASAIKPLKLRYRAAFPSIPLILTAVAAQPHLTVTAFIYGATPFTAMGHPTVVPAQERVAIDRSGRSNYPMLLARTIDEAGGDAFVVEYSGSSAVSNAVGGGTCCGTVDTCNIGNDDRCQCPGSAIDAEDCAALGDLGDGVTLLQSLAAKHPSLTRITTRISPEEMTFDPTFEPTSQARGRLFLSNRRPTLDACESDVIDRAAYAAIRAVESCAAMYCGAHGRCVTTAGGPACACGEGTVAQQFVDLDGKPSVTCVPRTAVVDLRAGGEPLPDACATASCGDGTCIDRNGVAVCACAASSAAVATTQSAPRCAPIAAETQSPGAENFSAPIATLPVCAPAYPACPDGAKYRHVPSTRAGVDCGNATPPEDMQTDGYASGGCCDAGGAAPMSCLFVVVGWLVVRRRRL